ncbi:uncharacterized protein LOC114531660 [Dendronephthya gigantea]|uniref:uncharacterized protein LOC114531660 n=1 Tax=Dendronephthya gigantea TaxID=151771 RepID=UPI00106AC246|nr:uncharacterized protein LOC114531660 [Dendronephthya gigantea]
MEQHGCIFIDATWKDMLKAFWYTTQKGDRDKTKQELKAVLGGLEKCLPCFSVRSALDLFLSVMQFPKGSEILMSAINIPDMVYIIEHHGLTVVPVDIDVGTLCPRYEDLKRLITPRTVSILPAHIYGRWTSMDGIIKVAQEHNLLVLEDCAESFSGLSDLGHPQSDLVFFSFGAIKYATAMGGAIVKVRNPEILEKMRAKLLSYPVFSESDYVERLFRYSVVMFLVNNPLVTKLGVKFLHYFSINYKEKIVSLLRGFPGNIIKKVRHQPSTSMLCMMLHKLQEFDGQEHTKAKINGDFVLNSLCEDILIPGYNADKMNYWLFPILVDNPTEWVKELEQERIEAYSGVTQLDLVKPKCYNQNHPPDVEHEEAHSECPHDVETKHKKNTNQSCPPINNTNFSSFGCINHDHADLYPHKAKFLIDHVVYLPVHKRVPLKDLEYLCKCVLRVAQRRQTGVASSKDLLLNEYKMLSKL